MGNTGGGGGGVKGEQKIVDSLNQSQSASRQSSRRKGIILDH